jgi:hypothetical protein
MATVVYMVNSGHVRLCGILNGACFDLATLAAATNEGTKPIRFSFAGRAVGQNREMIFSGGIIHRPSG